MTDHEQHDDRPPAPETPGQLFAELRADDGTVVRQRVSTAEALGLAAAATRGERWALTSAGNPELSVGSDGELTETVGKRDEEDEGAVGS